MTDFFMELDEIVKIELEAISEKQRGINLLETLKFNLIPKLSFLKDINLLLGNANKNFNKVFIKNKNEIHLNCNYNLKTKIELKKVIVTDTLFILIQGGLKLDIYNDIKLSKYKKLNIFPLTGICLPLNTVINLNFFKNSFFIEFTNIELNKNIENSEKDSI